LGHTAVITSYSCELTTGHFNFSSATDGLLSD